MEIILWICAICVVCIIAGVIFYKPYLGVVFVIVSIPFEGAIDFCCSPIYPLETVLAILALICICKYIVGSENRLRNKSLIYCYFPFMLCILLSSSKCLDYSLAVKEVIRWLELIAIYFLAINLINDYKKTRVILYSMILVATMVSIYGIINYLSFIENISWGHRAVSVFGNPNALGGYVCLVIPVIFGMLIGSTHLWEKITLSIVIILLITTWILTFSISSWTSLILTMIILFVLAKLTKRVVFITVILSIVVVIICLFTQESLVERSMGIPGSLESRIKCYPVGLSMVKDDLIFGIGVGNFSSFIKDFDVLERIKTTNLHNLYLQIFVEAGLMGLCTFLFWLVCVIRYLKSQSIKLDVSENYNIFVGLVGGVIVFLINNIGNVTAVHGIHLQWGTILGLAVVLTQFKESETCSEAA
jgi:O-antigen ligase